jgi:hypothetical protein
MKRLLFLVFALVVLATTAWGAMLIGSGVRSISNSPTLSPYMANGSFVFPVQINELSNKYENGGMSRYAIP